MIRRYCHERLSITDAETGQNIVQFAQGAILVDFVMQAAAAMLEAGAPVDAFIPTLRRALAAVPPNDRGRVRLHLDVMKVLLAPVLALFPPRDLTPLNDDGSPVYRDKMSDSDAQEVGKFWYSVAAGEWAIQQAPKGVQG